MATPRDLNLISAVRKSAKKLGRAVTWLKSGQPLRVSDDFLFEMYVLFDLALDLSRHYRVEYEAGTGNSRSCFPRKPAQKRGRPRFNVFQNASNRCLWQVCAGTKIGDIHNVGRAPDISIQKGNASDEPTHKEVYLIWDAKYRQEANRRIAHNELAEFGRWVELFELRNAAPPSISLQRHSELLGNCLVTNGEASTEPDAERQRLNIIEVASFYPGKKYQVLP